MSNKKASCGGLEIDNETIFEVDGILKASGMPDASQATDGQILAVKNKKWEIVDNPNSLPAVTPSDAGRVLMVNASGKWVVGSIG